jgi:deazaflavin-dependent oxidoreductase (nitroreductase family)
VAEEQANSSGFPDVRWGSESSWLRRPLVAFAATRFGAWSIKTIVPLDRRVIVRSRGRYTLLGPIGAPSLLLTTTGAKSGLPRTCPLLYCRDGAQLVVIGSNFGQEHHPAWAGNLLAHPEAVVSIGGVDIPVRADLLQGAERQAGIDAFIDLARNYAAYLTRTDRAIRVFALSAT